LHYDVMVTLILLFLFVSPRFIDFKDRPVETVPLNSPRFWSSRPVSPTAAPLPLPDPRRPARRTAGQQNEADRRASILRIIEPISGAVTIERDQPVSRRHNKIVAYNVWVIR